MVSGRFVCSGIGFALRLVPTLPCREFLNATLILDTKLSAIAISLVPWIHLDNCGRSTESVDCHVRRWMRAGLQATRETPKSARNMLR